MYSIIICMLCGIVAGFFLRRWRFVWLDKAIIVIIWLLLFELGVEVGGDRQVLEALPTLGLSALEIAVVAMLGSCLAAMGLARWIKLDRRSADSEVGGAVDAGAAGDIDLGGKTMSVGSSEEGAAVEAGAGASGGISASGVGIGVDAGATGGIDLGGKTMSVGSSEEGAGVEAGAGASGGISASGVGIGVDAGATGGIDLGGKTMSVGSSEVGATVGAGAGAPGGISASGRRERPLKGSLIILAFFVAGCLLGYFWRLDDTALMKEVGFYTLAVLIVMVGISIGHNRDVLNSLKSQDKRLLLLPVFTILGTLSATALLGIVMPFSISETLAVGSGQAYYSLSSIMITQNKGIELGTVALLANIIREILTLLSAPLLVIVFGRLAPISSGGATTADTTLPIIRQVCGSDLAILSVYHGFVVDFSVPFMVTLFCSL